jgi:nicotinamidase-related amidase
MSTALLVIDVQQALCFGEEAAFESERLIERINRLSSRARQRGVPVILVQHEEAEGSLERGSEGWQLARGLLVDESDLVIGKTASDAFHQTTLQAALAARGVDRLVICGLQSDFCIDSTTRRALALGYPVTLVSDAHSTCDSETLTAAQISAHHTRTLSRIGSYGASVSPVLSAQVEF